MEDVRGKMMEDIVLLDRVRSLPRGVFKVTLIQDIVRRGSEQGDQGIDVLAEEPACFGVMLNRIYF